MILNSTKTRVLWDLAFSLFSVSWVMPTSISDSFLGWEGSFLAKDRQRVWKAGPLCIFWSVWKARNDVVFRNEVLSIQRLKSSFVPLL